MDEDLVTRIAAIARAAAESSTTVEAAAEFRAVVDRLQMPIRLAIAGKVKAGKSTLLNALIGEELAPTDAGECTRILTMYRYSDRPFAMLHPKDGAPVERRYTRRRGALDVDLGDIDPESIDHLEIGWPTRRLADLTLIDSPGIASLSTDVSAITLRSLTAESGRPSVADAVLYLLRHTHVTDLRFLEAFHDDEIARGTPVNTVGVLSRADEIGSCRLDAMEVAARIARRYAGDPRLHRLCPVVVPVNGLLANAAATLREEEYAVLRTVARSDDRDDLLLTADRFASNGRADGAPEDFRSALLDRFGMFGVRLAVELIGTGKAGSSSDLARHLAAASGLDRLRSVVLAQFQARARVLKARSAVAALEELLNGERCRDGPRLLGEMERVTASAHEFEELRILMDLRSQELSLSGPRADELDRLMGGFGHDAASRLGLEAGASAEAVRETALRALRAWQAIERHPLSSRSVQAASRAACRTLEGMLREVGQEVEPSPADRGPHRGLTAR